MERKKQEMKKLLALALSVMLLLSVAVCAQGMET